MTFLMSGNTTAALNFYGTVDVVNDKLAILVRTVSRISNEVFTKYMINNDSSQ